jgi:glycosylphosphatidylinositol deacylase
MFTSVMLPKLLLAFFLISFVPLPKQYYLGGGGDPVFSPLAPILLLVATGLVCVSWWLLSVLMWPMGLIEAVLVGRYV